METASQEHEQETGAAQATDQAKEAMGEAAGQAREAAHGVASQAQDRVREQIDQRSTEAGERVGSTAQDIRSVGEELQKQGKERPAKVARQAAERVDQAGSYLRESDSDRILSDIEDFGRRRPWAVLAGATVAGLAAARFLKASSRERYTRSSRVTGGDRTTGRTALSTGSTGRRATTPENATAGVR